MHNEKQEIEYMVIDNRDVAFSADRRQWRKKAVRVKLSSGKTEWGFGETFEEAEKAAVQRAGNTALIG